jgi:hypothetical protein
MLNNLKQDICEQEAFNTLVANIEKSQKKKFLSLEVKYACLY